jgi:sporulation protein YlmC with PRC-barrel domain
MELNLAELRKKRVVNVCDGKELGRVCDISFKYPSGEVIGFIVSGKRGIFGGDKSLIKLTCVVKIGKDAVLVDVSQPKKEESFDNIDYDEE